ncbi:metal ABC transporter permease [Thiotrichales bacterium 19S9-12]|nr:metal ABC transporter permease [Thiotrichales bacterium 19S9-11]MCF6811932.1 metal ABC transporter permease [Thiotrichales bacterium 19S9-12]
MFSYTFMQYALIAGTLTALTCGIISVFVVTRKAAFAAHALSHISITGAALALLTGFSALTGQLIINLFAAILMGLVGEKTVKNDQSIGMVLTFFLGIGALSLFLYQSGYAGSVMGIMFGNLLAVSLNQIYLLIILSTLVLFTLAIVFRPLWFMTLEPDLAKTMKLPNRSLTIIFFSLVAITVTMACQVVGALLVFALLIGPGMIAAQWASSVSGHLLISLITAILITWVALIFAFYLNWPISFCVTLLVTAVYLIGLIKSFLYKN